MSDKQFVQKKVRDLMAWFKTKDQSFVEDHLRNLVSNKAKKQYQEISQLIISEFELMLATAESKYQFYVSFLHVIYDQDLFDSKVQSIVEYSQINDAKINQSTSEVSGVSEVSIVCSEHEVPMEKFQANEMPIQTPIGVQSVQFEGEQLSLQLEQPSDVSKDYSTEKLLNGTCSTVLLEPVSMVLKAMPLVHTAATISAPISVSVDEKIKEDGMSYVVKMFPNVVLWMVVWCFGRHADTFRGGGSNLKCHHAALINFSCTKMNPSVTVNHLQEQCSVSGFKAQEINEIRGSV